MPRIEFIDLGKDIWVRMFQKKEASAEPRGEKNNIEFYKKY